MEHLVKRSISNHRDCKNTFFPGVPVVLQLFETHLIDAYKIECFLLLLLLPE